MNPMSWSDTMKIRIRYPASLFVLFLVTGLFVFSGCGAKTGALFTKPELINYSRLAVLGLTPEQEQIFMACYTRAFRGQIITFVERNRLHEVVSEQDLLAGRLNDRTRARMKQLFGVEALIMCSYYDGSGVKKKLRVRIVDSATGAISGSVITQARDNFEYHCIKAVNALKADVMKPH